MDIRGHLGECWAEVAARDARQVAHQRERALADVRRYVLRSRGIPRIQQFRRTFATLSAGAEARSGLE